MELRSINVAFVSAYQNNIDKFPYCECHAFCASDSNILITFHPRHSVHFPGYSWQPAASVVSGGD